MPRRLIAILGALLVVAACSGDEDDAPATSTTTRAPARTTTTVPPSLTERTESAFPQRRVVEVRDTTLAPGVAIGFAFHPNGTPTSVTASIASVELCPATTDGVIDLTGGSWPTGAGFESCRPLDQGVPSPGTASHVGWALRSTAADTITVDATITYDANDGFFLWAPPTACGALALRPETSDVVGVSGTDAQVSQGGAPIEMRFDEGGGHELRVGRVVANEDVEVTCASDRAPN